MNQEQVKETTPWFDILLKAGTVAEGDMFDVIQDQIESLIQLEELFEGPSFQ